MKRLRLHLPFVTGSLLFLLCSCDRASASERAPGSKQPTSATAQRSASAADDAKQAAAAVAKARCDRELRCGNVGGEAQWENVEACVVRMDADIRSDDQRTLDCPGGYVKAQFEECERALADEECGTPPGALAEFVACRESEICAPQTY
jgi:hypothetical protein